MPSGPLVVLNPEVDPLTRRSDATRAMCHGACNPRIASKSFVSCMQRFYVTAALGARPASIALERSLNVNQDVNLRQA